MRSTNRPQRIDIDTRIPSLVRYLKLQDDIVAAMLYGSYGTVYQTLLSDVDLALLFHPERRPSIDRILTLEAGVSSVCQEDDINILPLNDADIILQFKVLESGKLIYERDPVALSDFREYVFKVYGDFAPFYRAFTREYDCVLKETYVHDRPRQT